VIARAAVLAALILGACSAPRDRSAPPPSDAALRPVAVTTTPVALNPTNPTQVVIDTFRYAGGISIRTQALSRLHGLSDLAIGADGVTMHAQGDDGDTLVARLVLGPDGRLRGLTGVRMGRLVGPDNNVLSNKENTDAEGMAVLADGSRLISFERNARILRYPAGGGAPAPVSMPEGHFPDNGGLEALAAYPLGGPDAYLAGAEDGRVWLCRLAAPCAPLAIPGPPPGYGLTGMTMLPGTSQPFLALLYRAWDPVSGNRTIMSIVRLNGESGSAFMAVGYTTLHLDRPLTRENFEGVAAVRRENGDVRLYLLVDDNFNPAQQTLLLAFDWTPPPPPPSLPGTDPTNTAPAAP
jgi:hypothetical protein